jgi:hypothetical protein
MGKTFPAVESNIEEKNGITGRKRIGTASKAAATPLSKTFSISKSRPRYYACDSIPEHLQKKT